MKIFNWTLCVIYFFCGVKRTEPSNGSKRFLDSFPRIDRVDSEKNNHISHNQAIRHRIFKENPRCRIKKTLRPAKLDYTFYSIFSAYTRYRLNRLKIRHETLYEVKNSTVNSSVLLPPHTLSSYFQSLGQHQPLEILFTIL